MEENQQAELDSIFKSEYPIVTTQTESGYRSTVTIAVEIKEPHTVIELVTLLDSAEDGDEIIFRLITPGGKIETTIMLCDAMQRTKAFLTAEIVGEVASAATILALQCDAIRVANYASFMIHAYSSGVYGKRGETAARMAFESSEMQKFFYDMYIPFLTQDECDKVLLGVDKYLTKDEILDRWEVLMQERGSKASEHMMEEATRIQQQRIEDAEQVLIDAGKL